MFSIFNGRTSFYQWDTDQKLIITSEIPDYQIHFNDDSNEVCFVVKPYSFDGKTVVDVPNILLQSSNPIIVWCYVLDENGNYTIKAKTFAVIKRQKPSDYIYTETGGTTGGNSNIPINYLESLDRTNPVCLCSIEPGLYILYGYFTPYTGSGRNITISEKRFVSCDVNTSTNTKYLQMFSPYKNTITYMVVSENSYERVDTILTDIVSRIDTYLSDTSVYPVQNKVITEAINALDARIRSLETTG